MRTIGVVTAARADYNYYRPILRRIQRHRRLRLRLLATGMHLSPEFGLTVGTIEDDDVEIAERVEMLLSSDTPEGIAKSMGLGTIGFSQVFARERPDLLLVLGDRFEMHAAVVAALPFRIPVAHLHGGEVTEGAIDEQLRHSITKMSHLHFAATKAYANRLTQMGEEPWRVHVTGSPALDLIRETKLMSRKALSKHIGFDLSEPPLLVTFHPPTLEYDAVAAQARALTDALEGIQLPAVITFPNADAGGRVILDRMRAFAAKRPRVLLVTSLGPRAYLSLMAVAAAMVGNSSSGIIEAPTFALPAVNIGTRQDGRERAPNVIDVGYRKEEILSGIRRALSPRFRERLASIRNPYGDGRAAERVVKRLATVPLDDRLIRKKFFTAS